MQLVVIAGPNTGSRLTLDDGHTFVIGRRKNAHLQLDDPHVSRTQCQLRVDGGLVEVTDLGSTGGTFINDRRVAAHDLSPGEVIVVGDTRIRFDFETDSAADTVPPPRQRAALEADALPSLVGETLHRYEVKAVIAMATTGMVFKCFDPESGDDIALKVLWPERISSHNDIQRFIRAMRTMYPLCHPNIVAIRNAGHTGDLWWVAMDYVEGRNLAEVIEQSDSSGTADWKVAWRVAVEIGQALEVAHEHGIVHRNITPRNILIRSGSQVALLGDLMLAKACEGVGSQHITRPGQIVGDLAWMAPERTLAAGDIDTRCDLYSLGATLYAMVTGCPPFEANHVDKLLDLVREQPPNSIRDFVQGVDPTFESIILRLLNKHPSDRYENPTELIAALRRIEM